MTLVPIVFEVYHEQSGSSSWLGGVIRPGFEKMPLQYTERPRVRDPGRNGTHPAVGQESRVEVAVCFM